MTTSFLELKERVGQVVGACSDEKKSELAISVLRYLHKEGAFGLYRKWEVFANQCYVTLPPDLDTPKKVAINGNPRPVQDFWHEFHDVNSYDSAEFNDSNLLCTHEGGGIRIEPNYYATACDVPPCGGYVYFAPIPVPNAPIYEEKGLEATIHGKEYQTNKEVSLAHNNVMAKGEVLPISPSEVLFSTIKYREIFNIIKPKTLNRYGLFWAEHKGPNAKSGLLAELEPFDTKPRFRRIYIPALKQYYQEFYGSDDEQIYNKCGVCLTILGTIKIKDHYDDNEIIPFVEGVDFALTAKAIHGVLHASNSDELNVALKQQQVVERDIQKTWDTKSVSGTPINVINFRARKLNKIH